MFYHSMHWHITYLSILSHLLIFFTSYNLIYSMQYVKCGFAGENFPTSVFPCVVGRPMLRYEESLMEEQLKVKTFCWTFTMSCINLLCIFVICIPISKKTIQISILLFLMCCYFWFSIRILLLEKLVLTWGINWIYLILLTME